MPRVNWDLKETWDLHYSVGAEGHVGHPSNRAEVRLHYHHSNINSTALRQALALNGFLGPAAFNKNILIVGGGFGWLAEELRDLGFNNVVVNDTSTYVQSVLDETEETEIRDEIALVGLDPDTGRGAELLIKHNSRGGNRRRSDQTVLNEDVLTNSGRLAIRQAMGPPDPCVTESVLESLEDQEAIDLSDALHSFPGQVEVLHLVYVLEPDARQDPVFNWKSQAEWKLLIPGDIFINAITFEVLS